MQKQLIFILGMHRSGTSALTRMVNLLGATLGNDLLRAQQNVNERGFWEHNKLLEINERILNSIGRRWYDIDALAPNWANDKNLAGYRSTIRTFIEDNFSAQQLSALKDPRLCVLLPIWKSALKGCELELKTLLMLRDPHQVVASICKRDPLGKTTAYILWAIHARDAELGSRDLSRSIVSYDQLLTDWRSAAERIATDIDLEWPISIVDAEQAIAGEIDPNLQHQSQSDIDPHSQIANLCQRIYKTHIHGNLHVDTSAIDLLWEELAQYLSSATELLGELSRNNRNLIDQLPEKQALGDQLGELRQVLLDRESSLTETQQQLDALGLQNKQCLDTLGLRDQQLETTQSQLEGLGEQHQHALKVVTERDVQIEEFLVLAEELEQLKLTFAVRAANKLSKLTGKK